MDAVPDARLGRVRRGRRAARADAAAGVSRSPSLAFVLGLAFSAFMDVWEWFAFWPHDWRSFALVLGRGFPFDVAHAVGNVVLALAAGPELRRLLDRYGRRLHAEVVWA